MPACAQYKDWLLNSGCLLHAVNAERFENSLKMQAVRDVQRELAHVQRANSTLACMDALQVRRRPETQDSKVIEPKPGKGCADSARQPDVTPGSRRGHYETEEALLSMLIPR